MMIHTLPSPKPDLHGQPGNCLQPGAFYPQPVYFFRFCHFLRCSLEAGSGTTSSSSWPGRVHKKCWKFALQGSTHCRYFPTSFFSTSS
jgi:hypothetical protein